jgi:hypothetical protein
MLIKASYGAGDYLDEFGQGTAYSDVYQKCVHNMQDTWKKKTCIASKNNHPDYQIDTSDSRPKQGWSAFMDEMVGVCSVLRSAGACATCRWNRIPIYWQTKTNDEFDAIVEELKELKNEAELSDCQTVCLAKCAIGKIIKNKKKTKLYKGATVGQLLCDRTGECTEFSFLAKQLISRLDIPTTVVTSKTHAFNEALIDEKSLYFEPSDTICEFYDFSEDEESGIDKIKREIKEFNELLDTIYVLLDIAPEGPRTTGQSTRD